MENQQSWAVVPSKTEQKTSLVALLFFLMGALHIYRQIQSLSKSNHSITAFETHPYRIDIPNKCDRIDGLGNFEKKCDRCIILKI